MCGRKWGSVWDKNNPSPLPAGPLPNFKTHESAAGAAADRKVDPLFEALKKAGLTDEEAYKLIEPMVIRDFTSGYNMLRNHMTEFLIAHKKMSYEVLKKEGLIHDDTHLVIEIDHVLQVLRDAHG